jgi:hypothetical protein
MDKGTIEKIKEQIAFIKDQVNFHGLGFKDKAGETMGILAEFKDPADLIYAAEQMREAGYKRWDCHSPFPIHGMDNAMGLKPSKLGIAIFCIACCGTMTGVLLQWGTNAWLYPYVISGKPLFNMIPAIPVTFELTILFSAFTAVFGMFQCNFLPRFHHPVFYSDNFKQASDDSFFISVEASDSFFEPNRTWEFLEKHGAINVEFLEAK